MQLKAEILGWVDGGLALGNAVLHFPDIGGVSNADLVKAVARVHDQRALLALQRKELGKERAKLGLANAGELVLRAGRVGQRAENVEERAHAQGLAHRRHPLHGRMKLLRKEKGKAAALHDLRGLRAIQVDARAQRLKKVGATHIP